MILQKQPVPGRVVVDVVDVVDVVVVVVTSVVVVALGTARIRHYTFQKKKSL